MIAPPISNVSIFSLLGAVLIYAQLTVVWSLTASFIPFDHGVFRLGHRHIYGTSVRMRTRLRSHGRRKFALTFRPSNHSTEIAIISQYSTMSDENITHEIAPSYKFKPIDIDDEHIIEDRLVQNLRQQESQHELQMVGADMIFREVPDNNMTENGLLVRRANPVGSYTASIEDDVESSCRVISPYPFSHTSQEEIEDREQLAGAFDWALPSDETQQPDPCREARIFEMDYARFFDMDVDDSPDADSDDFSVASSVSIDLCLDGTDPTAFWDVGMNALTSMKNDAQRPKSPSQVSLSS